MVIFSDQVGSLVSKLRSLILYGTCLLLLLRNAIEMQVCYSLCYLSHFCLCELESIFIAFDAETKWRLNATIISYIYILSLQRVDLINVLCTIVHNKYMHFDHFTLVSKPYFCHFFWYVDINCQVFKYLLLHSVVVVQVIFLIPIQIGTLD